MAQTINYTLDGTPPSLLPLAVAVRAMSRRVEVDFSQDITLTVGGWLASNWSVTPGLGAVAVDVTGVSLSGRTVILTTTEHTTGAAYTLHIPAFAVANEKGGGVREALDQPFVGVGGAPTVVEGRAQGRSEVVVTFSEPVQQATALDTANYSIEPMLAVRGVRRISDTVYCLTVDPMAPKAIYTVTVTGILDLAGNPI